MHSNGGTHTRSRSLGHGQDELRQRAARYLGETGRAGDVALAPGTGSLFVTDFAGLHPVQPICCPAVVLAPVLRRTPVRMWSVNFPKTGTGNEMTYPDAPGPSYWRGPDPQIPMVWRDARAVWSVWVSKPVHSVQVVHSDTMVDSLMIFQSPNVKNMSCTVFGFCSSKFYTSTETNRSSMAGG